MKRKLVPTGTGWAIYMQKSILQLMQIDPKISRVMLQVDNDVLRIQKFDENGTKYENALVKKFIQSGNGAGVYITMIILQLLNINPEVDEIEYRVKGQVLEITKAS